MIKKFKNSRYYYEKDNDTLSVHKRFLSSASAISTIIFSLIFLSDLIIIMVSELVFENKVYPHGLLIMLIIMVSIFAGMLIIGILSLVWKPAIAVFYKNFFFDSRKKTEIPYASITRIDIKSFKTVHAVNIGYGYQVDHLLLFIELNNAQRIKLVEIADKKHSDELDAFKLLLEQFISINKTDA